MKENFLQILLNENLDKLIIDECRGLFMIWVFFEYFMFRSSRRRILTLRNYFWQHIFQVDISAFDLHKKRELSSYSKADLFDEQISRIFVCLRLCDLYEASKIFIHCSHEIQNNRNLHNIYSKCHYDVGIIFNHFGNLCESYNTIASSDKISDVEIANIKSNIETFCKESRDILEDIMRNELSSNEEALVCNIQLMIGVFGGDKESIGKVSESYKELILMHVYYRFYFENFYTILKERLDLIEDNTIHNIDKILISTIQLTPFEFYQNIKSEVPTWFLFHIMDMTFDMDQLPEKVSKDLDNMKLKDYDYVQFMIYLVDLSISFRDFCNYSSCFSVLEIPHVFYNCLDKISIKNVLLIFEIYEETKDEKKTNGIKIRIKFYFRCFG